MNYFMRVWAVALLPVIVASALFAFLMQSQTARFERTASQALSLGLTTDRKEALSHYVAIARRAIESIPAIQSQPSLSHQEATKLMLDNMLFGADGYYYAYQLDGVNRVHASQPHLVGQNLIDRQDANGDPLIRNLINAARQGTGYHSYLWNRPSTQLEAGKIGYAELIPEWDWMLGTGVYTDHIDAQVAELESQVASEFRQMYLTLFVLMLLALAATSALVSGIRFSEGRAANIRLRELASQLVQVQEIERKRISLELHDGIGQSMVSAMYALDNATHAASSDKKVDLIERAREIIASGVDEIRRISRGLRPAALDDLGLAEAVRQLARSFEASTNIQVELELEAIGDRLLGTTKTTLYRMVQEALNNTAKHAKATKVKISLKPQLRRVLLEVSDNGSGFSKREILDAPYGGSRAEEGANGIGLRGMIERIESEGGRVSIDSAVGAGTKLSAFVPVIP